MKGFVFTLDMFLAVTVAAILLIGVFYTVSVAENVSFSKTRLNKHANDVLTVLDKNQTLDKLSNQVAENALSIVDDQFNAVLRIKTYSYSNARFQENSTITVGVPSNASIPNDSDVGYGRRMFLTFSGNRTSQYGIAELWVWLA